MSKFTIELNSDEPNLLTYIGIGLDWEHNRVAITAKQVVGDRDVLITPFDGECLDHYVDVMTKTPVWVNPTASLELQVLLHAKRELKSDKLPEFIFDNNKNTIRRLSDGELIAAPHADNESVVAVCKVIGASDDYVPSYAMNEIPQRSYAARHLYGHNRPN